MRRPITLIKPERQQDYVLFVVLVAMIVIALLVVTAAQSYNIERRISTNDADRGLVTTLAEAALCESEDQIFGIRGKKANFTKECKDGFYATPNMKSDSEIIEETATEDTWERKCSKDQNPCIDTNGREYSLGKSSGTIKNPHYIIEHLGRTTEDRVTYRVTAKAQGENANIQIILQSYVASE